MGKVLIIGPSWVGDMVMAQALAKRLVARPEPAEVHMVAPPWALPLVERMPEIARGWALDVPHGRLGLGARWRLGRALAAERFDEAIILPRSLKSALVPAFAAVPRRRGLIGEARYGLINAPVPIRPKEGRTVDEFVALSGDGAPLRSQERPRLVARPVAPVLERLGVPQGAFAVLCPGAEYGPAKRWPPEHFKALAGRLRAAGLNCLLIGSAKDGPAAQAIVGGRADGVVDLTGRTALTEAVDLLAAAAVVVTNDSGLMHVAAAVDTPVVALYGSSSAARTPPLSSEAIVVETEIALTCRPCFARECRFGHTRCLTEITPERVAAIVTRIVPGPAVRAAQ